jgi:hypothetical protein
VWYAEDWGVLVDELIDVLVGLIEMILVVDGD